MKTWAAWTRSDELFLTQLVGAGVSYKWCARLLQRSLHSIRNRAYLLHIQYRRYAIPDEEFVKVANLSLKRAARALGCSKTTISRRRRGLIT